MEPFTRVNHHEWFDPRVGPGNLGTDTQGALSPPGGDVASARWRNEVSDGHTVVAGQQVSVPGLTRTIR